MLKPTTSKPSVTKLNVLNKLRSTVKTSVDRLIMRAKVPAIEKRSFHIPIAYTEHSDEVQKQLIFLSMKEGNYAVTKRADDKR